MHDPNLVFWTAEGYHSDGGDRTAFVLAQGAGDAFNLRSLATGLYVHPRGGHATFDKTLCFYEAPPPEGTRVTSNVQKNGPAGCFLPSAATGCYAHPRGGYATLNSGTMVFFDEAEPRFRCRFEVALISSVRASWPRGRATSTTRRLQHHPHRTSVPPRHRSPPSTTS